MTATSAPPAAAMKRGMGSAMAALLVIIFMALGFVAGAYIGPRIGLGGTTPPTQLQTVVVGTNTPFPPFESRNATTNALEGFDIDLMNEIGKRNNWNIVFRDFQDWDALLAAIQFQGVDVGASSITSSGSVGATRNLTFDFSNVYHEADQAVLIKTGTTPFTCSGAGGTCTVQDLANHSVATQTLTSSYWWVQDNLVTTGWTTSNLAHDFGDLNQVIQELLNGGVQWVMVDKPIAQKFSTENPQMTIAGTIETNELYAYAVADGDPGFDGKPSTTADALIPKINAALDAIKADGTFATLRAKWLG